jgi:hypothetical protein
VDQLFLYEGILLVVSLAAIACARWTFRLEQRRGLSRDHTMLDSGWDGAVGYASGAVAFLLGLMLFFSVSNFSTAQNVATDEAIAYAAAFDAAEALPETPREVIQRDLVCTMRATRTGSWVATSNHDLTGDENVTAWFERTTKDVNALDMSSEPSATFASEVRGAVARAGSAHQARLLSSEGELPAAVWVIIYLSIFVLIFMFAMTLFANPLLMTLALSATVLLTGAAIAALVMFAQPFSDPGIKVQPTAISGVILRLQNANPGPIWDSCPVLATYSDKSGITLSG